MIFMDMPLFSKIRLLLCAVLLALTANIQAEVYLVSVGVSDYPGKQYDLRLPAADAQSISQLYETNNKAHVTLLINEKATKDGIIKEMNNMFAKASRDDIVVFFFSGHGAPGVFNVYDGNLKYDDIVKAMASSKSINKMIFADACFSGKIRQNNNTTGQNDKLNVMLFLSSRSNEYSIERRDMKNGLFTSCLIRCLKGGSDFNKDRIITAKELYEGVRSGVVELSKDEQHPVMWGNFSDDMPVMKW